MNLLKLKALLFCIFVANIAHAQGEAKVDSLYLSLLKQKAQEHEGLQQQVANLQKAQTELSEQLRQANDELQTTKQARDGLQSDMTMQKKVLEDKDKQIKNLEKQVKNVQKEAKDCTKLEEEAKKLRDSHKALEEDKQKLEGEKKTLQTEKENNLRQHQTEKTSLKQALREEQAKLKTLQGFANAALSKLKQDVQNLPNIPSDSPEATSKPTELRATAVLLKDVLSNPAEVDALIVQITNFEQAIQAIAQARQALSQHYDKNKVQAALSALSQMSRALPSNSPVVHTKKELTHFLNHYCICYLDTYNYFRRMMGFPTISEGDLTDLEKYEYSKGVSPPIKVVTSYPVIQLELNILRNMPGKRKLTSNPFKPVTCP